MRRSVVRQFSQGCRNSYQADIFSALIPSSSAAIEVTTILTDPILQGLAIALLFGFASSTHLTISVISTIYVGLRVADRPVRLFHGKPYLNFIILTSRNPL